MQDHAVVEAAYDDAAGVTRDFDRNVLRVRNRALGADFEPEAFRRDAASRIEMHLVARGAIRRAGGPPLAFFERPEWMAAWFREDHTAVTAL